MNALHGMVSGYGIFQYIFAPVAFILSFVVAISKRPMSKKIIGDLFALLSLIAVALMLYGEYLTSLGW